ncbi:hypothetical protein HVC12_004427 [Salmonella enterica]|uniref:hypothetical protein n=1 Tax=Klebsiella pneumoniae TaxID=573 RepID=UPI0012C26A14|nr:hypothetical protein [Salmonella enterica]ECN2005406.1 hypothetical protein [Salmonella enterica subsp. enterica serovar Newport]EDK3325455.1 hypothetical protein [Salmonella enterica subsp. enterica serovar Enteritidis]EEM8220486.1 hypothetical protein [Salmonella enterica subsp. enterica serovar Heidelberg]EEY3383035.1 hypothetical protein [Escherichia coli]EGI5506577.1 hypothetical protein [Salmonella enterica subsp. enterica serovar 47:z4,z23:-]EGI6181586.1 hypothetical protein [Salmon
MENLSVNQERFRELVSKYPTLYSLWDWESREIRLEAFKRAMTVLSSGEYIMAIFFARVWLGKNEETSYNILNASFDFVHAAKVLDNKSLLLISNFFRDPFWP